MKYFLDTEFIEGFHKPLFGKRRHFIDLISIGIYCEDGRELHLISNQWNYNDADDWVKVNVIHPLYRQSVHGDMRNKIDAHNFHNFLGWTNNIIANKIVAFCGGNTVDMTCDTNPEFYAYYADYDWVVFCSLFGRMIDLPKGFPMYCKDLKQMLDACAENYEDHFMNGDESFEWKLSAIKNKDYYPKQSNEHNALDDAKWNYELYKFLKL